MAVSTIKSPQENTIAPVDVSTPIGGTVTMTRLGKLAFIAFQNVGKDITDTTTITGLPTMATYGLVPLTYGTTQVGYVQVQKNEQPKYYRLSGTSGGYGTGVFVIK